MKTEKNQDLTDAILAAAFDDGPAAAAAEWLDATVAAEVADADHHVRASLAHDLACARTDAEREALEALIVTRHDWLDATFRDALTGAEAQSPAAVEADRLWAVVAAERAAAEAGPCEISAEELLTIAY